MDAPVNQAGKVEARRATLARTTSETDIRLTLDLDGSGAAAISTGVGMYDHLLESFARHGQFERRVASPEFDPAYYIAHTPAAAGAASSPTFSPLQHFLLVGQLEGRLGHA